jgi:hypothetical protein
MMRSYLLAATLLASAAVAEHVLVDFADPTQAATWMPIHDRVMGGRSEGGLAATAEATAVFQGTVSLANGGGFASVRSPLQQPVSADCRAFVLEVRGDGQRYQLRLRTDARFDGIAYRAYFDPPAGEWVRVRLPLADFVAVYRGRPVARAPALRPGEIRQLGLMIAEQQAGDFRLELRRIVAECGEENSQSGERGR